MSELVASIDAGRSSGSNLSSAIRVYILEYYRARLEQAVGTQAGSNAAPSLESSTGKDDFRR